MHTGTGTGTGMGLGMGMGHWWQHMFGDQDVIDSIHGFTVQYDDDHVSRLSSIYIYYTYYGKHYTYGSVPLSEPRFGP